MESQASIDVFDGRFICFVCIPSKLLSIQSILQASQGKLEAFHSAHDYYCCENMLKFRKVAQNYLKQGLFVEVCFLFVMSQLALDHSIMSYLLVLNI